MMVKTFISSNTAVRCHIDPHLVLLGTHVTLHSTTATALELNVFVFLSSLFSYFKQCVSDQPVKQQISNGYSTVKPFTANKLTKRKDLQKGMDPVNYPPPGHLPVYNSREGLTHTVSDSSLCAHHVNTFSSTSLISLNSFNKDPNGRVNHNIGVNKTTSKQQITASSESLNMAQFEMHTSLRIKRPPSGKMMQECFVNKTAKSVSFQDYSLTDKAITENIPENGMSPCHGWDKNEPFVSCSYSHSNKQLQSTAIIADHASYRWLVKTLSSHGVALEADSMTDDEEEVTPADVQDAPLVSFIFTSTVLFH